MASLFPRWTNTVAKVLAVTTLTLPVVAVGALWYTARTPFVTNATVEFDQPVQFDHRHHSWEQGIDCRYCHASVEVSANAGLPSSTLCIGCHGQVWNKSPRLEKLRRSYFDKKPLEWTRVHDVPEFVYFNHSIHLAKGVGCVTCHGRVDQMPVIHQATPMTMQWCLACHRAPGPFLRPVDQVTSMTWAPPVDAAAAARLAAELTQQLDVKARTSCNTCHR